MYRDVSHHDWSVPMLSGLNEIAPPLQLRRWVSSSTAKRMNILNKTVWLRALVLLTALALTSSAQSTNWKEIATQDQEFSILIPGQPKIFLDAELDFDGGVTLKNQRVYVVCGAGIAFIVELYDASNPRRDVKGLLDNRSLIQKFDRDISLNGYNGKQYHRTSKDVFSNIQYYTGRKRIYVIQVIARDASNPVITQFLSSLKLGAGATGSVAPIAVALFPSTTPDSQIYMPDEVDRRAIPVWKPEPSYSPEALDKNVTGNVLLQVVITPTGQVSDATVLKGLGHGLNEKAIEVAKATLFIPAEKNGHPVSQYIKVEYNFETGR
jgi:TonB family protein